MDKLCLPNRANSLDFFNACYWSFRGAIYQSAKLSPNMPFLYAVETVAEFNPYVRKRHITIEAAERQGIAADLMMLNELVSTRLYYAGEGMWLLRHCPLTAQDCLALYFSTKDSSIARRFAGVGAKKRPTHGEVYNMCKEYIDTYPINFTPERKRFPFLV